MTAQGQKKPAGKPFTNTGFYDGITMTSKESGDYGGISVYLTESDGDTYALVTVSEGMPLDPVLVPVKVSGKGMRTVEFTYNSPAYSRELKLKGTITATRMGLDGYNGHDILKRKCANAYSNITVGKQSGDYGGMEVYLEDTGPSSWFALVTIAEGVLKRPVLVNAKVTGKDLDKIEFSLPTDNGERKFAGTISRKTGKMTLKEGRTASVLKSKCYQ